MPELPIRCQCGSVTGVISDASPKTTTRLVCMCEDCQAYAQHLGRTDMLDEYGGTEVAQTTPSRVTFESSANEHICGLRLGPKGLYRWYAGCCQTPLANTLGAKLPFIGVMAICLEGIDAVGPVLARVNGRQSPKGIPPDGHARAPLGIMLRAMAHIGKGVLQSASQPNPFFGPDSTPRFAITVLELEQREALRATVAAQRNPGEP